MLHERFVNVRLPCQVNVLLLVLVEHDVAHVFDVVELEILKELDDLGDVLLLDPDEEESVLHHVHWDRQF